MFIFPQPTTTHYFIKMLNDKGQLLRNYTQVQSMVHNLGLTNTLTQPSGVVRLLSSWTV